MKQANRQALDEPYVLWRGEANGCEAVAVIKDPSQVLFERPFITPLSGGGYVVGVELVDEQGCSHAMGYRYA